MASIGPTMPPHLLSKRKRDDEDDAGEKSATTASAKKSRAIGPALPPALVPAEPEQTSDSSDDGVGPALPSQSLASQDKTKSASASSPNISKIPSKVLGPSLPPADLHQRSPVSVEDGEDSDDDFGPSLPGTAEGTSSDVGALPIAEQNGQGTQVKSARDEWMLAPPTSGDWTSRIDPSKMKNRGFSSGKGARIAPGGEQDMSLWTETPQEKLKRLEAEMLGVGKSKEGETKTWESARRDAEAAATSKKIQAYNVRSSRLVCIPLISPRDKNRAAPLYSGKGEADEDDPSKRAFDREKDIGGSKLSHAERQKMMNKAADFGSRFSKGTYL